MREKRHTQRETEGDAGDERAGPVYVLDRRRGEDEERDGEKGGAAHHEGKAVLGCGRGLAGQQRSTAGSAPPNGAEKIVYGR